MAEFGPIPEGRLSAGQIALVTSALMHLVGGTIYIIRLRKGDSVIIGYEEDNLDE